MIALRSLAVALCLVLALPLHAQTTPEDDVPVIDLAPVLDLPAPSDQAPEITGEPASEIAITPPSPDGEPLPEVAVSVPQYDRSSTSETDAAPLPQTVLLPLRADRPTMDGIIRLSGEVQSAGFFVDLPPGTDASELVLAYRIAINVLPEQSQLQITVNDTTLDPIHPTAFEGFESIVLPGNLLQEGRNRITVTVRDSHRIRCGPEATFAVWTEIDTNSSGARLSAADLSTDAVSLALAVRAQLALSGDLPVRLADQADTEMLAGLSVRLAALRDGAPVVLRRESLYGTPDEVSERARITVLHDGAPLAEVRRGADGALVLVLAAGPDGSLPPLDGLLPLPAPVPGNPALTPGKVTPLRALTPEPGESGTEAGDLVTYNRYSELPVRFRLPDDWLLLASQKGLLRLAYDFADGLPKGALMLVKVNNTTVRLLPLDRGALEPRPLLDVGFPARLLHPGVNAVTFVAIIPGDPPDLPCPSIETPLLRINPDSTLEVPPSPRMIVPGMRPTLTALRPDQIVAAQHEQPVSVSANNTTTMLAAALRPIEGTTRIDAASLTVIDTTDLGLVPIGGMGISRRELGRVLAPPLEDEKADLPTTPTMAERLALPGWLRDLPEEVRQLAMPGDGPLPAWLQQRQAKAVLLQPGADTPENLWLILGPGADLQHISVQLAQARLATEGPVGRVSLLTPSGEWQSWRDSNTPPRMLEPLGLTNFHDAAGNYASWSPFYFGLALFGLTFLSVALALIFVVTTRGRRKR